MLSATDYCMNIWFELLLLCIVCSWYRIVCTINLDDIQPNTAEWVLYFRKRQQNLYCECIDRWRPCHESSVALFHAISLPVVFIQSKWATNLANICIFMAFVWRGIPELVAGHFALLRSSFIHFPSFESVLSLFNCGQTVTSHQNAL